MALQFSQVMVPPPTLVPQPAAVGTADVLWSVSAINRARVARGWTTEAADRRQLIEFVGVI
jgi:hypothetical protein